MRRERGSAYLYVIVLLVVMGSLLVNLVPYATQARTMQARRAIKARADMTGESLVQQVVAEANVASLPTGSTRSLTLNRCTADVTVSDGADVVPGSLLLTGTTTTEEGQKFKILRYVQAGVGATPYSFAVYSATDMNWAGKLVTGTAGADGDVFCNGKIDLRAVPGTTINGNVSAKASIQFTGESVTGNVVPNSLAVAMPPIVGANYQLQATYQLFGTQTIGTGATFGPMKNGHYEIDYVLGNVSFQGSISGQGVVFVQGNITLTGNVYYANATSRVAIICTGDVTIGPACAQSVGILYCGGNLIVNSPDYNVVKGSIVAKNIASGAIIRATRDNFMQTSTVEGTKLCLPGFWP